METMMRMWKVFAAIVIGSTLLLVASLWVDAARYSRSGAEPSVFVPEAAASEATSSPAPAYEGSEAPAIGEAQDVTEFQQLG